MVNNTLEIEATPFVLWDPSEEFDFQIVETPQELETMIRNKAEEGLSTA